MELSQRLQMLRREAMEKKSAVSQIWAQARVWQTLAISRCEGQDLTEGQKSARGLVSVIENFRPYIAPMEQIVGVNFGDGEKQDWSSPADDENGRRELAENGFTKEQTEAYFEACRRGIRVYDFDWQPSDDPVLRQAEEEWASIGRDISSNHTVLGYDRVLKQGFSGLLREVEEAEKHNGFSPFYDSLKEICRAASLLGERYARAAEALLCQGNPAYDPEDLRQVIAVCRRVPAEPAETFREAVQSLWFAHMINTWEDTVNANSLGRLDQILYPYYEKDLREGRLTKEQAFEILGMLWIKLYRDYDVQQSCIGGRDAAGNSQVNELSYLMLDVTEALGFVRCLSVRFDARTDKAFLRRSLEVVGHVQKGVPFFFNDDVMIPALESRGIAHEDAAGYTQIGCVETVIPGASNPHAVAGEVNCLKALEYVFCDGDSMMYPDHHLGLKTGPLSRFTTFESLYDAVLLQMERALTLACQRVKEHSERACMIRQHPYKSLLTRGCLESGLDFNQRGARYDYYQIMLSAIPNLADSLMVLKKFVYEEKTYTLEQIKEILIQNFPDESVRLDFLNKAPKYGNGIEEVDLLASDITSRGCDMLEDISDRLGLSFHAQPFTYLWMVEMGQHSAASPDGRRKGEILAYSVSPMQGRDFKGLTALLSSLCKMPTKRTPGTTSAIVEVDPKLFNDRNIGLLTDILVAAGKQGLSNIQFNTVDAATLIDAKAHPEKYNNLAVRVSGFSQKFNLLTPELQDHIIGRTKHVCL